MRNSVKWAIILALCCAAAIAAAAAGRSFGSGYGAILRANWGFDLPRRGACAEVYAADSGESFHGDGLRYHVYSCRDTHLESLYAWLPDEHATIYHDSFRAAAEDWLEQLGVPDEQRPAYADCYYWYQSQEDNSELIVFWDKGRETLYVLESFL